jgi:hypothetical protein
MRTAAAAALVAAGLSLGPAAAATADGSLHSSVATGVYHVTTILTGTSLSHPVGTGSEPLTQPDDITSLGGKLFVAFQNGVGSMGEPTSTGNSDGTVVELTTRGAVEAQWDLMGKVDGMTADPAHQQIIVTVNEDGNSSLYTIDLAAGAASPITHYVYVDSPLPHGGGTDAVTIDNGRILVSASAPTVSNGPAVYAVGLEPHGSGTGVATVTTIFNDNSRATPANPGAPSRLALTDPDSNAVVPASSPRFAGDFMLDSQGDQQQVYASHLGASGQRLSVLALGQSVDDTAWVTDPTGTLFATDATVDSVKAIKGHFRVGTTFASVTPCNANSAPSTCPGPGYPPNYLGSINLVNGQVAPVTVAGLPLEPKGLVFLGTDMAR